MRTIDAYEKEWLKKAKGRFNIGDVVDVHVKIIEGEKERIQIFSGTVIKKKGAGLAETFTVRRIVQGEGVERIFPLHSPKVIQVAVKKQGKVRRAKLYYLRERIGRATKVEEILDARRKDEAEPAADVVEAAPAKPEPSSASDGKASEGKPAPAKESHKAEKSSQPQTTEKA